MVPLAEPLGVAVVLLPRPVHSAGAVRINYRMLSFYLVEREMSYYSFLKLFYMFKYVRKRQ